MFTQNNATSNIPESQSPDTLRSEDDRHIIDENCLPEFDILHLRYWNVQESLPWKLWLIVENSAVSRSHNVGIVLAFTYNQ